MSKVKIDLTRFFIETMPEIKKVIINPPATIIIWKDGTKTVCKSYEEYDQEVGVAMCIAKKYFGSRNQFTKAVKGAMKDFEGRRKDAT